MTSRVKSRADKSRDKDKAGGATSKDSAAALSTSTEIVVGKFSENEWHQLIIEEENEAFCVKILEEMLQQTMDQCYQKYIERQMLPFTVETAKDALLEIVELRFLERDFGETSADLEDTWAEDDEAEAVAYDSWAVGAVPCTIFPSEEAESLDRTERSMKQDEIVVDGNESAKPEQSIHDAEFEPETEVPAEQTEGEASAEIKADEIQHETEKKEQVASSTKKKRRKYKPYRGPIGSAGVSRMSETLLETEIRLMNLDQATNADERMTASEMPVKMQQALKAQAGRPPGLGDAPVKDINVVIVDSRAVVENVASIQVKTNFSIVDPEVEAAQQRLIAMRTGKFNPLTMGTSPGAIKKTTKFDIKETKKQTQEFRNEQQLTYERAASNGVAPVPPPLIESMDVAPGVTVREGGRVKQGPKRLQKQNTSTKHFTESMLLPVNRLKSKNTISVTEIINPIQQSSKNAKPLPPIA